MDDSVKREKTGNKGRKTAEQWVIIADDSIKEDHNGGSETHFCRLRHPKSEKGAMFMFGSQNTSVCEVISFKPKYQSWLINQTVQQDGSLFLSTKVDPVFLILPYLIQSSQTNKFMTLDQIVEDDEFPECQRLCTQSLTTDLNHVTDIKGDDDLRVYRYSKDKTLTWLKSKVERVAQHLEDNKVNVSGGSQIDTFIQSSKCTGVTKESYICYAHGLISDYLPVELGNSLREYLGIQEIEDKTPIQEPPAKRARTDKVEALEDYSKENKDTANKQKVGKLSIAQKKLSKVDKSGMKSIGSFFSPKTKN